ncbi:MAG: hypothetical protein ACE5JL_00530 [Dehalococcoidia bacterium]
MVTTAPHETVKDAGSGYLLDGTTIVHWSYWVPFAGVRYYAYRTHPPSVQGAEAATMNQQASMPRPGEQGTQPCHHRWDIQPPNGPMSEGTCQNCGEVREFKNSPREQVWRRFFPAQRKLR